MKKKRAILTGGTIYTGLSAYKKYMEHKEKEEKEDLIPRDIFGYCLGCTPDICKDPCSKKNGWNLPFK